MTERERQANLRNYEKLDVMIVVGQNRTRAQIEKDAAEMTRSIEVYKAKKKRESERKTKLAEKKPASYKSK